MSFEKIGGGEGITFRPYKMMWLTNCQHDQDENETRETTRTKMKTPMKSAFLPPKKSTPKGYELEGCK